MIEKQYRNTKRPNAQPLVDAAIELADGIVPDAVDRLYALVQADREFLASIVPAMLRSWCASQISTSIAAKRTASFSPKFATGTAQVDQRGGRLAAVIIEARMAFPLPGGRTLGEASAAEVSEGAAYYRDRARDSGHKARWLEAIQRKMGNAHSVRAAMSEHDLDQLHAETE